VKCAAHNNADVMAVGVIIYNLSQFPVQNPLEKYKLRYAN